MSAGTGLFVDDSTFAAWAEDGRCHMPHPELWGQLVAQLRVAAAINADSAQRSDEPGTATAASEYALQSVVNFLQRQPYFDLHGEAVAPLGRLLAAVHGLGEGRCHPMFEPIRTPGQAGAPGNDLMKETIKGLAARAVTELCEAETPLPNACKQVADALQPAAQRDRGMSGAARKAGFGQITAAKVKNWRARIMEGPGPGATQIAIANYHAALPSGMGDTPAERAKSLLKVLRERTAVIL